MQGDTSLANAVQQRSRLTVANNRVQNLPSGILVGWNEISKYLRRHRVTLWAWNKRAPLPLVKLGRTVQTSTMLLDRWLMQVGSRLARDTRRAGEPPANGGQRIVHQRKLQREQSPSPAADLHRLDPVTHEPMPGQRMDWPRAPSPAVVQRGNREE